MEWLIPHGANGITWGLWVHTCAYPSGRIPVMAPLTWDSDGFPFLQTVNHLRKVLPLSTPQKILSSFTGTDSFTGSSLGPEWEWNHNPDTTKFSVYNGLQLQTATVTNDSYAARNSLTHCILGPASTTTIGLNYTSMHDGVPVSHC
ncbi:hypothetical protein M422DRAFT_57133 [Sphaerobolus stellatus SS14]|uniref:Beta-xylosidase C-terminal Concanavalin A-like domain-containing protein n=1 Tax=Sphaerobolus stellatus (strain SS14) TaxID=990650 RepID=A0A0C9U0W6_SPHS4|nr:hypothetical protein M422DRAFT_57133 [Sphaerobolus stellatus SS14]